VLTDVERIAPCLPGAQLQEVEGDDYRGIVKVKVGPITAQYKGSARFLSKDDQKHEAVLRAEGRDTRGQGNANATITASLRQDGTGTAVTVVTDLTITGKVAQFGRGVLVDVSGKLLNQFVDCLENDLLGGAPAPEQAVTPAPEPKAAPVSARPAAAKKAATKKATATAPAPAEAPAPATAPSPSRTATAPPTAVPRMEPAVRKIDHAAAEPVDLLDAAGVPVAKRAIPIVAGVLLILWFLRRRRRR
jgi:carbon monoxide dehydrogenase subunit G